MYMHEFRTVKPCTVHMGTVIPYVIRSAGFCFLLYDATVKIDRLMDDADYILDKHLKPTSVLDVCQYYSTIGLKCNRHFNTQLGRDIHL